MRWYVATKYIILDILCNIYPNILNNNILSHFISRSILRLIILVNHYTKGTINYFDIIIYPLQYNRIYLYILYNSIHLIMFYTRKGSAYFLRVKEV